MTKSVNIRLDPVKDKDIIFFINHSKFSGASTFKFLARNSLKNLDETQAVMFDNVVQEKYVVKHNDTPKNNVVEEHVEPKDVDDKQSQEDNNKVNLEDDDVEKLLNLVKGLVSFSNKLNNK